MRPSLISLAGLVLAGVGWALGPVGAATYFVADFGNDGNSGLTWADAKLTPKAAIDAAVGATPDVFFPGFVTPYYGAVANIPSGWALCDGTNGTPDLRGRFVMGANLINTPGSTGGSNKTGGTTLAETQMPSHAHGYTAPGYSAQGGGSTTGSGYPFATGSATGAAGGSQPHNHDLIPSYYALHFIMKL